MRGWFAQKLEAVRRSHLVVQLLSRCEQAPVLPYGWCSFVAARLPEA
jgi:hypothetical protein